MPPSRDIGLSSVLAGAAPTALCGSLIGFCAAFCCMRWGYWLLPSPLAGIVETIVRAPSLALALIPQLLANRFLGWTEITLYTASSWAIIGGVEASVWRQVLRSLHRQDQSLSRRRLLSKAARALWSIAAILGIVASSWIAAFILCLPFGVCPSRPNLMSIMSPSLTILTEETGMRFPAGTSLLYSDYSSFQGSYGFSARLEVPRAEANGLLRLLPPAHRASVYELRSESGPEAQPWQDLRALRDIRVATIPAKGLQRSSGLIDGKLWVSARDPRTAVIYLSGNGH